MTLQDCIDANSESICKRMARLRKRCRDMAAALGCSIEIERHGRVGDQIMTYWVYGPPDVYDSVTDLETGEETQENAVRRDPHEGDHAGASWAEVLDRLETYRNDLHFHRLGIDEKGTAEIVGACGGAGAAMLADWIATPPLGVILADWLGDEKRDDLRDKILAAMAEK